VCKGLTFVDGCAEQFSEERMRARVGVSPRCAQPTSWMRVAPLTFPMRPTGRREHEERAEDLDSSQRVRDH